MTPGNSLPRTAAIITAIIAVAIQAQVSLFAQGNYHGLRINLADFFLPAIGLYVLLSLMLHKTRWPAWHNKYTPHLLLAVFAALTIALINGYFYIGFWSSWALINKYAGFIILMCYFALGGWLITNFDRERIYRLFIQVFCGTFIITLALSLLDVLAQPYTKTSFWIGDFNWDGLMANRNAYMVATAYTVILLLTYSLKEKQDRPLPFAWPAALWTILPTFVLYNASRTGWIAGAVVFCLYLLRAPKKFLTQILPFLIIGTALIYLIFNHISFGEIKDNNQLHHLIAVFQQPIEQQQNEELDYMGDQKRYIALEDGMELYRQSNPLIGAGLGAYKPFQIKKRGAYIDLIDWSVLWLLTETGIVGLSCFSAFFILCLWIFYKEGIRNKSPFHTALLYFLLLTIAMSFLHELLYTRFLWFALGLGMGENHLPANQEENSEEPHRSS